MARKHRRLDRFSRFESLETRCLLTAELVAHWTADDLNASILDGAAVSNWFDSEAGLRAAAFGQPRLVKSTLNGHSALRFSGSNDRFQIQAANDPFAGSESLSIVVVFATNSDQLAGGEDQWYFNSGLVDANGFGLTEDWGVAINAGGTVSAGMGKPAKTIYSSTSNVHDGLAHVAIMTWQQNTLTLIVDGSADSRQDVSDQPRSARVIRFGSGGNPFDGDIAEIRFYSGAMELSEAMQLTDELKTRYLNLPPVAVNDQFETDEDSTLTIDVSLGVLANDSDPETDELSAIVIDPPEHGNLQLLPDGSFSYEPEPNFFGIDHFTYSATDPAVSNVATVTINVRPAFDQFSPSPDRYLTVAGSSLNVEVENGVLANDSNPDAIVLDAILLTDVDHGTLTWSPDGAFAYAPQADFSGEDQFTYRVIDANEQPVDTQVTLAVFTETVLISELGASNLSAIDDEDGESSDWIELWNFGLESVDLNGWYLSDRAQSLDAWQIPDVILEAGDRVTIFASNKDRRDPAAPLHTNFKLSSSGEYLALVHRDGKTVVHEYAPQFPLQWRDVSYGIADSDPPNTLQIQRFENAYMQPTPGEPNTTQTIEFGPFISDVEHAPLQPSFDSDLIITAAVTENGAQDVADVFLHYRLMYGDEVTLPMVDDGSVSGDQANDGIYTAILRAEEIQRTWLAQGEEIADLPGKMFRYYVTSSDNQDHSFRLPFVIEGTESAEYFGTVFRETNEQTQLPVLNWFVPNPNWHRSGGSNNVRWSEASVYFDGEFYDNVKVRVRGQTTISWAKPKFKFEFNPGNDFRYSREELRVDEFNLQSHFIEKGATSYMGANLAFGFLQDIGVPAPNTQHFHVRQNGEFYSLASFIEQVDATFLQRNGFDPSGSMYKANSSSALSTLNRNPTQAHYQKVTRKDEPFDDLIAFTNGINDNRPDEERLRYLFDHVNLPQIINDMAGNTILTNHDRLTKNYYVYLDPKTDEWNRFPWDMDQAFALRTTENFASILYGDTDHPQAPDQPIYQNHLLDAILDNPITREMYVRRLRTLIDDYLNQSYFENRMAELLPLVKTDAEADHEKWRAGRIDSGVARIRSNLDFRRTQLAGDELIPESYAIIEETTLLDETATAKIFVPKFNGDAPNWAIGTEFVASSTDGWLTSVGGIGYETGVGYEGLIGDLYTDDEQTIPTTLLDQMDVDGDSVADLTSVYARFRFDVSDPNGIDRLALHIRYDDGFVAFLNGVEVARENYRDPIQWDRTATANHEADEFEVVDLTTALQLGEAKLQAGENVLAVQIVNRQANSPDFLLQPRLIASRKLDRTFDLQITDVDTTVENADKSEQYVAITNHESFAVDVSGWQFKSASSPFQPGTVIPAGGTLYVANDVRAFRARQTGPTGGTGLFVQPGLLPIEDGQILILETDRDGTIDTFRIPSSIGDFNGDAQLNADDIDYFCQRMRDGSDDRKLDVDQNGTIDLQDYQFLIEQVFRTTAGDANLDGRFDSRDLVAVFQSAEFEDQFDGNSSWADGDWNCDGDFNSSDLVAAFQGGGWQG